MTFTKGLDPVAIARSGVTLRAVGADLDGIRTAGRTAIARIAAEWEGSDADDFQRGWVQVAAALTGLSTSLDEFGRKLDANVRAQESTSSDTGLGGWPVLTGGPAPVHAGGIPHLTGGPARAFRGDPPTLTGGPARIMRNDPSFADSVRGTEFEAFDRDLLDMADQTYAGDPADVGDFEAMSAAEVEAMFGIDPALFDNNLNDGFAFTVYQDGDQYVVAFRGSDPLQGTDWFQDGIQAAGLRTPQYESAIAVAQTIHGQLGDNVVFTGHSLGGGLATVAAATTGAPAITFNSAGVHDNTMATAISAATGRPASAADVAAMRDQLESGQIRAYQVMLEPVTSLQVTTAAPDASGTEILLPPASGPLGLPFTPLPGQLPMDLIDMHNTSGVQSAMDHAIEIGLLRE